MGEFVDEYIGIVESVDLELANGRCKIRVMGVYGHYNAEQNKISTENLPWAYPKSSTQFASKNGAGQLSLPRVDTKVRVTFESGDHMHPRYTHIEEVDPAVISMAKTDPDGFTSLFWDAEENIKMYFTKGSGYILDYKDSIVNIQPNGIILIDHKNSESGIELKGNQVSIRNKDDSLMQIKGGKITLTNKKSTVELVERVDISNQATSIKKILTKIMTTYMKTKIIDGKPLNPTSISDAAKVIVEINKLFK